MKEQHKHIREARRSLTVCAYVCVCVCYVEFVGKNLTKPFIMLFCLFVPLNARLSPGAMEGDEFVFLCLLSPPFVCFIPFGTLVYLFFIQASSFSVLFFFHFSIVRQPTASVHFHCGCSSACFHHFFQHRSASYKVQRMVKIRFYFFPTAPTVGESIYFSFLFFPFTFFLAMGFLWRGVRGGRCVFFLMPSQRDHFLSVASLYSRSKLG